jgi:hypothetical protein
LADGGSSFHNFSELGRLGDIATATERQDHVKRSELIGWTRTILQGKSAPPDAEFHDVG